MSWQLPLVALIVTVAALYLCRRAWRTWGSRKAGCGGSCGCARSAASLPAEGAGTFVPVEQLRLREPPPRA